VPGGSVRHHRAPTSRGARLNWSPEVERVFREDHGRVLAALTRRYRDLDLAEDALQDALVTAGERWPAEGMPDNPAAWLTTTARHKAIDRLRRENSYQRKLAVLPPSRDEEGADDVALQRLDAPVGDDRLSLLFMCCHPALDRDAQVALTLRSLGGLTTAEIARAFLVAEPTMGQRISRAKAKIERAGIPFRVPPRDQLADRLGAVLEVLYLIYNEGYSASSGDAAIRVELTLEASRLARIVMVLIPDEPEATGLMALMLFHDSRRSTRLDGTGAAVPLEEHDRTRWDTALIAEADKLLERAARLYRPGPYQLQAAIAGVHATAPSFAATDWARIVVLYDRLAELRPTPVVSLNRAVAIAMRDGPEAGLALIDEIADSLAGYRVLPAARADLLRRAGRYAEARNSYEEALALTRNDAERRYLQRRLAEVTAAATGD
jgi:RNA polymerase sigma-70 factor, ECF subfamily